jgi:hypothetical protein
MQEVRSFVNNTPAHPARSGRYLAFEGLQKGAAIRLDFPNTETKEEHTIGGQLYRATRRGSTVIDIEPRPKHPGLIPLYQRAQFWAPRTPMHTVRRFVPNKILPVQ